MRYEIPPLLRAKAEVFLDYVGKYGRLLDQQLYRNVKQNYGIGRGDADKIINHLEDAGRLHIEAKGVGVMLRRVAQ